MKKTFKIIASVQKKIESTIGGNPMIENLSNSVKFLDGPLPQIIS